MVRHPTPQTLLDARKLCALPAPSSTLTSEEEEAGKASRDAITHHPYRLTFKKKEGEEARPGGFSMSLVFMLVYSAEPGTNRGTQ